MHALGAGDQNNTPSKCTCFLKLWTRLPATHQPRISPGMQVLEINTLIIALDKLKLELVAALSTIVRAHS